MTIYKTLRPNPLSFSIGPPALSFYITSVSLNALLTLMIVTRLILHKRNIRNAMGTTHKPGGLYDTVATMLIESCAISAATYLVYIALWGTQNPVQMFFFPLLILSQVRTVFILF